MNTNQQTENQFQPKSRESNSIIKLFSLFTNRERLSISFLFFLSLFTAVLQSTGIVSLMPFMSIVMDPKSVESNRYLKWFYEYGKFSQFNDFVIFLGSLVIILLIVSNALASITTWMRNRLVLNINYTLSSRLLGKYLSRPYEFFLHSNSNELGMNILSNVNNLGNSYLWNLLDMIINVFMTLTLVVTLLVVDYKVTLWVFTFFGLMYGVLTLIVRSRLIKTGKLVNQFNKERHKTANEALSSIKITKALNLEEYFLNRFKKAAKKFSTYQSFSKLISEIPNFAMEGIVFSAVIAAIIILIIRGNDINSFIPTVSLFAFAGYRLMPALSKIFKAIVTLIHNKPILDKVYNDMNDLNQVIVSKSVVSLAKDNTISPTITFEKSMKLEHIKFDYHGSKRIIDDISLTIENQSIIGFAGTTGAGKTTLIDIFLGLLYPQEGKFTVDDVEINEDNVQTWRKMIGYVPQDIFLIDDTIAKNIAFGKSDKDIDLDKVKASARIAAISEFIETQLEDGYDTHVGERGVRLSGGQRQRIGLARALYRSPTVLILDEATSALDGTTEEQVLDGIYKQSSVKTMLIIAHRLNTLKVCNKIYLLEKGRVIDSGTYDELIEKNPKFMKMAKVE